MALVCPDRSIRNLGRNVVAAPIGAFAGANEGKQKMITPTQHDKSEWLRCATAIDDRNSTKARRFRDAATLPPDASMSSKSFDTVQKVYRAWLVFDEVPDEGTANN